MAVTNLAEQEKRRKEEEERQKRRYERSKGKNNNEAEAITRTYKKQDPDAPVNNGGFWGGVGYLGEKFAAGVVQTLEGFTDYISGVTTKAIGDLTGNVDIQDAAYDIFDNQWWDGAFYRHADEWYNPDSGWKTAGDVAGGIGTSTPGILLNLLPGGQIISPAFFGISAAGNATSEAVQQTGSLDWSKIGYGAMVGATEAGVEALTQGIGVGSGRAAKALRGTATGEVVGKLSKNAILKMAAHVGVDFASEATEEAIAEIMAPVYARMTYDQNAQFATPEQVWYAAFVGGMSGILMGGGGDVINTAKSRVIGGNIAKNQTEVDKVLRSARQISEFYQQSGVESETMKSISAKLKSLEASMAKSGNAVGNALRSEHQKKLLGDLAQLNTAAAFETYAAQRAYDIVQNIDAFVEKASAYKYTDPEGNPITVSKEALLKGVKVDKNGNINRKSLIKAIRTNRDLQYFALMDMAGRMQMDTAAFTKASMEGVTGANDLDLARYLKQASPEQKAQLASALGYDTLDTVSAGDFNASVAEYVGSAKYQNAKRIMEASEARRDDKADGKIPKRFAKKEDGTYVFESDGNKIAVTKEGDTYSVYDYTIEEAVTDLSKTELNRMLGKYAETHAIKHSTEATAATETTAAKPKAKKTDAAVTADIEAFAKERVKGYSKLLPAEQTLVERVIRQGKAMGVADDILAAYANVCAHAKILVQFRRNLQTASGAKTNGWYDKNRNAIVVDPKATNGVGRVLIHELDHAIRTGAGKDGKDIVYFDVIEKLDEKTRKKITKAYSADVKPLSTKEDRWKNAVNEFNAGTRRKIDVATTFDEMNAYYAETVLSAEETVERLVADRPSLKDKILGFFSKAKADYKDVPFLDKAAESYYQKYKKMFDKFAKRNAGGLVASVSEGKFKAIRPSNALGVKHNLALVSEHKETLKKKNKDYDHKEYDLAIEMFKGIAEDLDSEFLHKWNAKDGKNQPFQVFKAQSGYKYNAELSTECVKGIALFEAIDSIVQKQISKTVGDANIRTAEKQLLYDLLQKRGFQIPCAICYVEQARQREGEIIQAFLDGKNGKNGKLGWNQALSKIEALMAEDGNPYTFGNFSRMIATDAYSPAAAATMTDAQDASFKKAFRKVANEYLDKANIKRKKEGKPLYDHVEDMSPDAVAEVMPNDASLDLKLLRAMYLDPALRLRIDDDVLYSSLTTLNLATHHQALYTIFNQQSGVGGYKLKQAQVVYWGEILNKTSETDTVRKAGGWRIQSNSDFQLYAFLDYVQMFVDLSAKGYSLHAYTKTLTQLKLFGLSGGKINASLIPRVKLYHLANGEVDVKKTMENAGLDENGNPIYDDVEGIPHAETFMLLEDPEYSKYCTGICIGYSDKHILKLLDDPHVQLIIGFHDKTKDIKKRYRGAMYATNYNGFNEAVRVVSKGKYETEHLSFNEFIMQAEEALGYDVNSRTAAKESIEYNGKTYKVDDIPRLAVAMYLQYCADHNMLPAYSRTGIDFSKHPNYYKLLGDYGLYDSQGHYSPQGAVSFKLPSKVPYLDANGKKAYQSTKAYIKEHLQGELAVRDSLSAMLSEEGEGSFMDEYTKGAQALRKKGRKVKVPPQVNADTINIAPAGTKQSLPLGKNVGYHAGDLGKSEYYHMQGADRSTGHFGTGTYFVGDEAQINTDIYGKRPHYAVDFSGYKLYKPYNTDDGYDLHRELHEIDGGIKEEWLKPAYDGDLWLFRFTEIYDIAEEMFGEDWYLPENQIAAYKEYAKRHGIEIESEKQYAKSNDIDVSDEYFEDYYHDYLLETLREKTDERNREYQNFEHIYGQLTLRFDKNKTQAALRKVIQHQKEMNTDGVRDVNTERAEKADSLATVFMKALGYDGIDVRSTKLDNVGYGSVIYDVKPDTVLGREERSVAPAGVKHSLPLTDSNGEALTESQREYFADSKVLDENGNLLALYHGTPKENGEFYVFDNNKAKRKGGFGFASSGKGFYFTTKRDAAEIYTRSGGKLLSVYVNIKNPYIVNGDIKEQISNDFGIDPLNVYLQEVRRILSSKGYDGIIQGKGDAQIVVAYYPEQIKLTTNKTPTTNPDIRYSLPLDTTTDGAIEHESRILGVRRAPFDAKKTLKKFRGYPTVNKMSVGEIKKIIANNTKMRVYSKKEVLEMVNKFTNANLVKAKTINEVANNIWQLLNDAPDPDYRDMRIRQTAEFIAAKFMTSVKLENPNIDAEQIANATYLVNQLDTYLKGITFGDDFLAELGNKTGTKTLLAGKTRAQAIINRWGAPVNSAGVGTPIDVMLSDVLGNVKGFEGISDMSSVDAFLYIDSKYREAKQVLKKQNLTWWEADKGKAETLIQEIARDIRQAFDSGGERSTLANILGRNTEYYIRQAQMANMDSVEAGQYNNLYNRIVYLANRMKDLKADLVNNATQGTNHPFKGTFETLSGIIRAEKMLTPAPIRQQIAYLHAWYVSKPTKDLLGYKSDEDPGVYSDTIAAAMETIALAENQQAKFSVYEMQCLDSIMSHAIAIVKNYQKVWKNGKLVDALPEAEKYIETMQKSLSVKVNAPWEKVYSGFLWQFGTPVDVMAHADKFMEGGFFSEMLQTLRDAAENAAIEEMNVLKEHDAFIDKHKNYVRESTETKVKFRGQEIPKQTLITLYMTAKREHAWAGLIFNGAQYKIGNLEVKVKPLTTAEELTYDEMQSLMAQAQEEMAALLTETDKEYIAILEKGYNLTLKEIKIKRDMERMGFTNAMDGYYIPLKRANMATTIDQQFLPINTASNSSFNKNTVKGAAQALELVAAEDLFLRHAHEVCQYAFLSPAIESFDVLWNIDTAGNRNNPTSLKTVYHAANPDVVADRKSEKRENAKRGDMEGYFRELIQDIQGTKRGDSNEWISAIRGGYATFQLGANPKVWMTQLSSIFASLSELDAQSVFGIGGINFFSKEGSDVDLYCPLAELRNYNNDAASAQAVMDMRTNRASEGLQKVRDLSMTMIGKMDRLVVMKVFIACQKHVAKHQGLEYGTEANKIAAGKLLKTVIENTQQGSLATEKSKAARGGEIMKTFTMFRSDAIKVMGRVLTSAGNLAVKIQVAKSMKANAGAYTAEQIAKAEADVKAAGKKFGKSMAALVSVSAFMTFVSWLFRHLYNKDEDKPEEELLKTAITFGGSFLGGLPIISDIYSSFVEGFAIENFALGAANDLVEAIKGVGTLIVNSAQGKASSQDWMRGTRDIVYAVCSIMGLPVRNLWNTVSGAIRRVNSGAGKAIDNVFYPTYASEFKEAIEAGDDSKAYMIMQILTGDRLDGADSAVVNGFHSLNQRLLKQGKDIILPADCPASITVGGKKIEFTTAEQAKIQQRFASKAESDFKKLFASEAYKSMTAAQKRAAVAAINSARLHECIEYATNKDTGDTNILGAKAVTFSTFAQYKGIINGIESDKDKDGNTISGSKREKVVAAIKKLKVSDEQKLFLIMVSGYTVKAGDFAGISEKSAKKRVASFIAGLSSLTKAEKEELAKKCGFEVKNGVIQTK